MVNGDEKWVAYDNIVRKRSWSKNGEAAQTVAKLELTARKLEIDQKWPEFGQQKKFCFPSGQRQATHVCSDSPETLGAWLGSFNASTIESGPGTK
ncbi:hypothetical protein TNCV_675011 [Trichonephila clavipes]|nr:hypothetical protein TNCV_675011 [Trichonephila clavipes]